MKATRTSVARQGLPQERKRGAPLLSEPSLREGYLKDDISSRIRNVWRDASAGREPTSGPTAMQFFAELASYRTGLVVAEVGGAWAIRGLGEPGAYK